MHISSERRIVRPILPLRVAHLLVSWRILRLAAPAYLLLMLVVWAGLLNLWFGGRDGYDRTGVVLGPDFPAFYTGGLLARQPTTGPMYDLAYQRALQQTILPGLPLSAYVNPPHYALVALPFSLLPYPLAFGLWSVLMAVAFVASIALLRTTLPTLQARRCWLLMLLALFAAPVYYAISAGQNTGLSLLLHVGILLALVRRRDALAGVLIALGLFKPQLFVGLLPLLLLDRRWQALASFAVGSLVVGALTAWFFGIATILNWIALLRSPIYQFEEIRQAAKMFSWQSFSVIALGPGVAATVLGWLFALGVFAGLAYLWWRGDNDLPLRYAITVCGLVVMGPHLPVYDLALLLLPGLVIGDRVLRQPLHRWLGLRIALLGLYVLLLFAAHVELRLAVVIVPLITLTAWLAVRLLPESSPAAVHA